jgi:hypothetical protein
MNALMPFSPGDIFVTASDLDESARFPTGKGKVLQYGPDWTLRATFETGKMGLISSLTLDHQSTLHVLDPQARARTAIGSNGDERPSFPALAERSYGSMLTLADGTFLIGEHMVGEIPGFSGAGKVYHIDRDGNELRQYDTETNGGMGGFLGVTHMARSVDGRTLYHCSETGAHIYGHDLENDRRLGPVYTRTDPPPLIFGIATLPDGDLLVAGGNTVRKVTPGKSAVCDYQLPEGRGWAVPVLRHDQRSFWALDFFGGKLACIDVESGDLIQQKELGLAKCLTGIAEIPA